MGSMVKIERSFLSFVVGRLHRFQCENDNNFHDSKQNKSARHDSSVMVPRRELVHRVAVVKIQCCGTKRATTTVGTSQRSAFQPRQGGLSNRLYNSRVFASAGIAVNKSSNSQRSSILL